MHHISNYYLGINSLSQVFLTQRLGAFHKFEDQLRIVDTDEQKRNRVRDSEAELDPRGNSDPYAPYHTPAGESAGSWNEGYGDDFNGSNAALPLQVVSTGNASAPFQRPDLYEDEFENKSIQSEEYNARSKFTSQLASHYGDGAADGIFPGPVG